MALPIKVLQLNTEKTWRGGERQTLYTIEGLRDAGHDVELLCRRETPMEARARNLGIKVYTIRNSIAAWQFLAVRACRYDLLHPQTAKTHTLAVMTNWFHNRPILYSRRVNFQPRGWYGRWKYRHTDMTVAISNAVKDTLEANGVRDVKIIPDTIREHPLDPDHAGALKQELKLDGRKVIATTGDLVPQKDPVTMVETIHHLAEKRRDFVFLHFGNTQMGNVVRPLIEKYQLQDIYLLLGHHDDVEDYFPLFDAFLITGNHTEGLCSSVFDAFVYKVPLVSTLAGGLKDSVGDRGFTCGEGEAACLAEKLDHLLDHPEEGRALAEMACAWAHANVSIPAITERYIALYRELMAHYPKVRR